MNAVSEIRSKTKKENAFIKEIVTNKFLYLLTLPGILFFIVFAYLPMGGLIIAFQDFKPAKGMLGSKFVGLKNFKFFFSSPDWTRVTFNTLFLNVLFIVTGLIAALAIAIMLSEIKNKIFQKVTQSVVILPHFISWTIVALFAVGLFSTDTGLINTLLKSLGMSPINFYTNPNVWPVTLVFLKLWHGAGFSSIVYLAAITGIDQEIYEAAKIDGATRVQSIFHITLPMLKSTIIVLLILGIGKIFNGDFGMIYAIVGDNSLLYPTTDVIDTYVYRALRELGDMGMSSAVGFFQSVLGFLMVIGTNKLAKRIDSDSAIF